MSLSATEIIAAARAITGNKTDAGAGETSIDDAAIVAEMKTAIRDLNRIFGGSSGLKEIIFQAVVNQQDYSIAGVVGTDVYEIEEVIRSDAYVGDYLMDDPNDIVRMGRPFNDMAIIPAGLQADVFRTIIQLQRSSRMDRYDWETIGDTLRLMPVPLETCWVAVRYTVTGYSIESLPTEAEIALQSACCAAILNAALNRRGSDPMTQNIQMLGATDQRLKTMTAQRDRYEAKYQSELLRLGRSR